MPNPCFQRDRAIAPRLKHWLEVALIYVHLLTIEAPAADGGRVGCAVGAEAGALADHPAPVLAPAQRSPEIPGNRVAFRSRMAPPQDRGSD